MQISSLSPLQDGNLGLIRRLEGQLIRHSVQRLTLVQLHQNLSLSPSLSFSHMCILVSNNGCLLVPSTVHWCSRSSQSLLLMLLFGSIVPVPLKWKSRSGTWCANLSHHLLREQTQ